VHRLTHKRVTSVGLRLADADAPPTVGLGFTRRARDLWARLVEFCRIRYSRD
jgi:hypothetical protein